MKIRWIALTLLAAFVLLACQLSQSGQVEATSQPADSTAPTTEPNLPGVGTAVVVPDVLPTAYPLPVVTEPVQAQPTQPAELTPQAGVPYPGASVLTIQWQEAVVLLKTAQIGQIFKDADLKLVLTLQNGGMVATIQPAEGELEKELEACGEPCKAIVIVNP